jgi:Uma2 family endonuclease
MLKTRMLIQSLGHDNHDYKQIREYRMGPLAFKLEETFTYGDYLRWDDGERWELIDGVAYNMSPAPTRHHQRIHRELMYQLTAYLSGKPCEVYGAPFDVRLPQSDETDEEVNTVVQPDIVVICDPDKLDDRGCRGAPDLVIEILSPATSRKDMKMYEKRGILEYWIVDPSGGTVMIFRRGADGRYGRPVVFTDEDSAPVGIFEDLVIDLKAVFAE